jgi:hypothetical protein
LFSIRKGRIGELRVAIDLLKKGYDVYEPIVDDNGIDLLVSNGELIKSVQCKVHIYPAKNTSIEINVRNCHRADILAVPIIQHDCVCYIETSKVKRAWTVAYLPSLSGQKKLRNWYEDYLEFPWDSK